MEERKIKPPPWTEPEQEQVRLVLENCLKLISHSIDWGEWQGRRRKPCIEEPLILLGLPLGQYHCPVCGDMQIAGMKHLPPEPDYERVMHEEWPAGYEDPK